MELVKTNSPKILVIDDDEQIRRLLVDLFEEVYVCSEASSAEEALLVLDQESFGSCDQRHKHGRHERPGTLAPR